MQTVGGTCIFKADGTQISIAGSVKYQPSNVERAEMTGADGFVDYTEKPIAPWVEVEFKDSALTDLQALQRLKNATVTLELANGRTLVLYNATQLNAIEMDAIEGKGTAKFICQQMRFI